MSKNIRVIEDTLKKIKILETNLKKDDKDTRAL
jgi:hypothetical protein